MYGLFLLDVRVAHTIELSPENAASRAKAVLRARSPELLEAAMRELRCKPYKQRIIKKDEAGNRIPNVDAFGHPIPPYEKFFKKGSILEWCVPPDSEIESKLPEQLRCIRKLGTLDEWLFQTRENYEKQVLSIPEVEGEVAPAPVPDNDPLADDSNDQRADA